MATKTVKRKISIQSVQNFLDAGETEHLVFRKKKGKNWETGWKLKRVNVNSSCPYTVVNEMGGSDCHMGEAAIMVEVKTKKGPEYLKDAFKNHLVEGSKVVLMTAPREYGSVFLMQGKVVSMTDKSVRVKLSDDKLVTRAAHRVALLNPNSN